MGNLGSRFPGKYLAKGDFEPPIKATISRVAEEKMKGEDKTVFYFSNPSSEMDISRGVVCNKTNWKTIARMHGQDPDDPTIDDQQWTGTEIVLYNDPSVTYYNDDGEEIRGGIRMRPPQVPVAPTQPAPTGPSVPAQEEAPPPNLTPDEVPF